MTERGVEMEEVLSGNAEEVRERGRRRIAINCRKEGNKKPVEF